MTKIKSIIITIILAAMAAGCTSAVLGELDALQDQIDRIRQDVARVNEDVSSIIGIMDEMAAAGYVTGYYEITEGDVTVGYEMTFNDGRTIRILNGKDGADAADGAAGANGKTPVVGIRQDNDGMWYWTVDGAWLTDASGSKVRAGGIKGDHGAAGADGLAGSDGIVPQFKIQDGWWYVSYDGGGHWQRLGEASGKDGANGKDGKDGKDGADGDSFIKDVTIGEDSVTLILTGGQTVVFPFYKSLTLTLSETSICLQAGQTRQIRYTVSGDTDGCEVFVKSSSAGWKTTVERNSGNTSGIISITAPMTEGETSIAVWAGNKETTVMAVIEASFKNYFKITNTTAQSGIITLSRLSSPAPIKLRTSTDGINWTELQNISTGAQFTLPANGYVLFDGAENATFSASSAGDWMFSADVPHTAGGNVMTLAGKARGLSASMFASLFRDDAALRSAADLILPAETLAEACYSHMFYGCSSLTDTPKLPATKLAKECYCSMFHRCTSLKAAPDIPAETLASVCCQNMFNGCTSLVKAPNLPATTMEYMCYSDMFFGCTALVTAPELPATTLAVSCYNNMFYGCSSLRNAPSLPVTTLADGCYMNMFNGCSSLTETPALPATTLTRDCYYGMFLGCTHLVSAPDLLADKLVKNCYGYMFTGCSLLNHVKCLATDISAEECTINWLKGVAATGTFVKKASMNGWTSGPSGIPVGWKIENDGFYVTQYLTFKSTGTTTIELSNTGNNKPTFYYSRDAVTWITWDYSKLTVTSSNPLYLCGDNPNGFSNSGSYSYFVSSGNNFSVEGSIMALIDKSHIVEAIPGPYCFQNLFRDCKNLTSAPALPATTLGDGCYARMFQGCTGLTSAPSLPAINLAKSCYYRLFSSCTSLTAAPKLPATKLAEGCYNAMFYGCTSLTSAPDISAESLARTCCYDMFNGCTSLVKAPKLTATKMEYMCYSDMFFGCTALVTAPELPATSLAEGCYNNMFYRCSSLLNAPALPVTTLADQCYMNMFSGCSSLTSVPALPATTLTQDCYYGMFMDCTSLVSAPDLLADKLVYGCYGNMFNGCSHLNHVKCLATDISADECTINWLKGVAATGTFVKKASMNSWLRNTSGIPAGWTVINDGTVTVTDMEMVDLGLSVKWASCNIGASKPEEYGDFYAWAETEPKINYDWSTYKYSNGSNSVNKYNATDGKMSLDHEDDVARVISNGKYRIPTKSEFEELKSNCTFTWTKLDGVDGYWVQSKTNDNSIFLPAIGGKDSTHMQYPAGSSGLYWTSDVKDHGLRFAHAFYFGSTYLSWSGSSYCHGRGVRPVMD